jgi:hypothetical protein
VTSGIGFGNRNSRPYRKHRPVPALIVIAVLCVGALGVWIYAITSRADINDAIRCSPAPSGPAGAVYNQLDHNALDGASPIPPDKIAVRVLNASQSRGQATIATETLRGLGFTQIAQPENDPAYANSEAKCQGEIRFGENGTSAARTLSLLAPCSELVKDNRQDASVDFVIGNGYHDIQPRAEGRQAVQQLVQWSQQHQGGGGEQSAGPQPVLDHNLLAAAREVGC